MKLVVVVVAAMLSCVGHSAFAGKVEDVQAEVKKSCSKDIPKEDALRLVKNLFLSCVPGDKVDVDGCKVTCLKEILAPWLANREREMLNKFTKTMIAASLVVPSMAFAQSPTLEERVAELEANQSLNIFSFSGMFQTRFDDIIKAEQSKPTALDNKDLTYLRMKFQFNVDANISKHIKFYSRLTTTKHFNKFYQTGGASAGIAEDLSENAGYRSSAVYLEKAYADFSIPDSNFTFSLGRLPTVDGQPQNYMDGRARMGTYPMLSYNSVFDGMGLTYKMDDYVPQDNKLALRLIYTPFSQVNLGTTTANPYINPPTTAAGTQNNPTMVSMGAAQVDYSLENQNWTDTMNLTLQYYQTGDLYYNVPTSTLYIASTGTVASLEFQGMAKTPWDLSLNYLMTAVKSSGSLAGVGFGTASGTEETLRGGIFLLATRYRLGTWVLGGEYVNGSEDSVYFGSNDDSLTDFYATRGDAYHLYFTKKFTQNLALRFGYMDQAYKYTPISVGPTMDSDRKIQTAYANLRLDF